MKMENSLFRIRFLAENWKLLFHLFFRTYHFGVNNLSRETHRSIFGLPLYETVTRLAFNYKMMRLRAFIGFIPLNDAVRLFPAHARKNGYHPIRPAD